MQLPEPRLFGSFVPPTAEHDVLAPVAVEVAKTLPVAGGCLCGIGFTMALFIAGLAFKGEEMVATLATAKIGILAGSLLSGALGLVLMLVLLPKPPDKPTSNEQE